MCIRDRSRRRRRGRRRRRTRGGLGCRRRRGRRRRRGCRRRRGRGDRCGRGLGFGAIGATTTAGRQRSAGHQRAQARHRVVSNHRCTLCSQCAQRAQGRLSTGSRARHGREVVCKRSRRCGSRRPEETARGHGQRAVSCREKRPGTSARIVLRLDSKSCAPGRAGPGRTSRSDQDLQRHVSIEHARGVPSRRDASGVAGGCRTAAGLRARWCPGPDSNRHAREGAGF